MKVLFVTSSYEQKANSAAIRNNAWVAGLMENGVDVDVLTIEWPEFMRSDFLNNRNKATVFRTVLPELKALKYTKSSEKSRESSLRRVVLKCKNFLRDLIYFPDVCKNWKKKLKDFPIEHYDIIISSSDFKSSHYAAQTLVVSKPAMKWIQVWGDPWSSDINLSQLQKRRVLKKEYSLLEDAFAIVYVSEITKEALQKQYPDLKSKIHYIPRGYYLKGKESLGIKQATSTLKLVYTGVLSTGRNIEKLLSAIDLFNDTALQKIELVLYGNYSLDQQEVLKSYKSVVLHESIDFDKVLQVYDSADVLLFVSNGAKSTQIPGKLFDYMGTTKPILCLCSKNEISLIGFLSQFDRCIIADSDSIEALTMTLELLETITGKSFEPVPEFAPAEIGKQLLDIIGKC